VLGLLNQRSQTEIVTGESSSRVDQGLCEFICRFRTIDYDSACKGEQVTVTLANATLACLSPASVTRGYVTIEDGLITATGAEAAPRKGDTVDCSRTVVMPGNVCAHTHLYSALARGMPAPPRTPHNFPEILEYIWWRLDRALDEPAIRSSGRSGVLDAVRCGTTTLIDHHASPECIEGSLDMLADAFEEVGARGVLCYEVTDRGGIERRRAGLAENERFLISGGRPGVKGMVGAHASFTLEDDTLDELAAMAHRNDVGVHIHVAEDLCDEEDALRRSGMRTAHRLHDTGILAPDSIAAHGVHLDDSEIETVLADGAWLAHNCRSNLNNRVGRARYGAFGDRGMLGTDGIDGDMFAESRTAFFRAREDSLDADAARFTTMLAAGARLASRNFPMPIGTLEPGAAADLMILDYDPPTPLAAGNLPWHWMFGLHSGLVRSVMVNGRWVLREGEFVDVDEEKIRAEARAEAQRLWQRMESL
jgi:putative selenium metabolism protein SsnA